MREVFEAAFFIFVAVAVVRMLFAALAVRREASTIANATRKLREFNNRSRR